MADILAGRRASGLRGKMVQSVRKLQPGERVLPDNDAPVPAMASLTHGELAKFRMEQGLQSAARARLVDWVSVANTADALRDGYLLMADEDGVWHDVRVVLRATYLAVLQLEEQPSTMNELVRLPPDQRDREVTIYKRSGDPLGLSIRGGEEHNLPILLSAIAEGGAAQATKGFFVGDEILAVDGAWLQGLTHSQAKKLLHAATANNKVTLRVSFYAVARQRILNEYLRTGDEAPIKALSKQWTDIRKIPLAHCYVSNHYNPSDGSPMERGAFVMRAADSEHNEVLLRSSAPSRDEQHPWTHTIARARDSMPLQTLFKGDPPEGFSGLVVRMGRVSERLGNGRWRDLFMALTDHELAFYSRPPTSAADLQRPLTCYPLLGIRYVPGARVPSEFDQPLDEREYTEGCFTIRLATGLQHYFSAGLYSTQRDWTYAIKSRTNNAVRILQTISYPAFHKGQPVTLTLDWIRGLTLSNDERGDKTVVWQYPFARLERTAHTAHPGSVCLDFTRHGGSWVENPGMIIFVLTAFVTSHCQSRTELGAADGDLAVDRPKGGPTTLGSLLRHDSTAEVVENPVYETFTGPVYTAAEVEHPIDTLM